MAARLVRNGALALLTVFGIFVAAPAGAQVGIGGGIGSPGAEDAPGAGSNVPITELEVEIRGVPAGDSRASAIRAAAARAFGISAGSQFNELLAHQGLARVRAIEGVANASYRLVRRYAPSGRVLVLSVEVRPAAPETSAAAKAPAAFPVLYQDDKSLLRVLLNGGAGLFLDGHPWFGHPGSYTRFNPLVENPATGAGTGARAAWHENYVEFGLGGATQIGSSPFYAFGAGTVISVLSTGQDIFRDDTRATTTIEKLYGGLLYIAPDGGPHVNVSAGRQNFTLNDGWLVSQFGSQWNAGPRPGVYLAPRTAHDFAALGTVKWDQWVWTNFYLDPNEYEPIESNTQLVGTNLRYSVSNSIYGDVSLLHVPHSDASYRTPYGGLLPREGLSTFAGHLRWADASVVDGLWLESEAARQIHAHFDMDAWAAYGTIGYLARQLPWTPSLSYRYAAFSGDKPGTAAYERFDTLYSGGLSEWLQGISVAKALTQSNRETHRVRFNVSPHQSLNLTLDYYHHLAMELNNLGANAAIIELADRDLAREVQFVARWAVSKNLFVLGVAAYAMPGEALKLATPGPDKPWTTLQAQLFWNF
jgi:hypothetical protein